MVHELPAALPRLQPFQPSAMSASVADYLHKKRRPHSGGTSCLGTVPNPRNFLMTGGGRAVDRERDDQLISLNKAAIKAGLQAAVHSGNSQALAARLMRSPRCKSHICIWCWETCLCQCMLPPAVCCSRPSLAYLPPAGVRPLHASLQGDLWGGQPPPAQLVMAAAKGDECRVSGGSPVAEGPVAVHVCLMLAAACCRTCAAPTLPSPWSSPACASPAPRWGPAVWLAAAAASESAQGRPPAQDWLPRAPCVVPEHHTITPAAPPAVPCRSTDLCSWLPPCRTWRPCAQTWLPTLQSSGTSRSAGWVRG